MSMRVAMNAATSSLLTIQSQMAVTSANIANADTDGYTRKVATQTATTTSGVGTGVSLTGISSTADAALLKSALSAASDLGEATAIADTLTSLGELFGTVDSDGTSGTSLVSALSDLEDALAELADTPESTLLAENVTAALEDLAAQLNTASDGVQDLRLQADSDIAATVDSVNDALETIDSLNEQIVEAQAQGLSTADLEDARASALAVVASAMDVTYFTDSTGAMKVYTTGGTILVDSSAHLLSFDAAGSMTADATYPDSLSGITVDGVDITSQIKSGTLAGLFEVRDETLPAIQDDLDALAVDLIETFNALSNTGTALPAPQSLTGTTSVSGSDALSATGTLRVAVVDEEGVVSSYADLDLSSYATVDDLIAGLNSISGVSASLDADGHLVIESTDASLGIALNPMDSSVGSDGASLTSYFGLNDLLSGTGADDIALVSSSASVPVYTLSSDTLAVGDVGVSSGDATLIQSMVDAMGGSPSFSDQASDIISDVSSRLSSAESALTTAETKYSTLSAAIASASGVNLDEETARLSELENAYSVSATLIETLNAMFESLLSAVQ